MYNKPKNKRRKTDFRPVEQVPVSTTKTLESPVEARMLGPNDIFVSTMESKLESGLLDYKRIANIEFYYSVNEFDDHAVGIKLENNTLYFKLVPDKNDPFFNEALSSTTTKMAIKGVNEVDSSVYSEGKDRFSKVKHIFVMFKKIKDSRVSFKSITLDRLLKWDAECESFIATEHLLKTHM